ncbi:MAG: hypothetical protein COB83_04165 [Gammaproteobacteria bacterium]|nr:MAG: hypothetical protein COB83_04165 [Gammaproteobacteria bacterium]
MHHIFEQSNLPFKLEPVMVEYLTKVINTIPDDESTAFIIMTPELMLGQPPYEFDVSLFQPFDNQWQLFKLEVKTIEQGMQEVTSIGKISRFSDWMLINDDSSAATESGHHLLSLWQRVILKDIATYPEVINVGIVRDGREIMTVPLTQ